MDDNINNNYIDQNNFQNQQINNNYNDANYYEENGFDTSNNRNGKKIIFIILGIILIILVIGALIFFVYKKYISNPNKNNNNNTIETINTKYKQSSELLLGYGKSYFNDDSKLPTDIGSCKQVTLKQLKDENLVTEGFDESCDEEKTYVKVCKLESGNYHYSTNISSTDESLNSTYTEWKDGTENDLINENYDIKFTYNLKEIKEDPNATGESKEVWKNELNLPDGSYSIIGEQTFYRYRDLLYRWQITKNYYYQQNGNNDMTNKFKVTEYYKEKPNNAYSNKDSETKVYKWYTYKRDVYNSGAYYQTSPDKNYPVKGEEQTTTTYTIENLPSTEYTTKTQQTIYQRRNITNKLTKTNYICNQEETTTPCENQIEKYVCYYENGIKEEQTQNCTNKYSDWQSNYNNIACTSKETTDSTCRGISGYKYTTKKYKWYTNTKISYYPSGSSNASDEKIYYEKAPVTQAIKDTATETTGYKWYKSATVDLGYAKQAPEYGAIKINGDTKYSSWSNYSLNKVAQSTTRQVEEKTKLTIKETTSNNGASQIEYNNLTNNYVTLEEMINVAKQKGYNVNSLQEINNNSKLKYEVKISYRTINNK